MEINQTILSNLNKGNTTTCLKSLDVVIKELYELIGGSEKSFGDFSEEFYCFLNKGIPPRFINSKITKDIEKSFIKNYPQKGLFLYGGCGSGKTYNLYGIKKLLFGNAYLKYKQTKIDHFKEKPKMTTVPEFISDLKSNFDGENSERRIVDAIKTGYILLLDDFGTEKITDWTEEIIYRLINHRYEYMKPTYFSSNLSPKELSDRVGDRIVSRIVEMCEIIKVDEEDRRLK